MTPLVPNFDEALQKQISKSAAMLRAFAKNAKEVIEIQQQWSRMIPQLTPDILHGKVAYLIHDLANLALDWETAPANVGKSSEGSIWTIPFIVNTAIQAWGKLGNATKAEALVERMLSRQDPTFAPSYETYVSLLDAFGKAGDAARAMEWLGRIPTDVKRTSTLSPARIHNSVLNAYARNGQAKEAAAYVQAMKEQWHIDPDSYSYSALIQAWKCSDEPNAKHEVEALLDNIKEQYRANRQDIYAPNHTVTGIAMSMASSPESCERMLDDLVQLYFDSSRNKLFEPNARHFMMVMNMYAKHGEPKITEEVFRKMEGLFRDGISGCRPTYRAFMVVVDAYCKQGTLDAARNARKLLDRLQQLFRKDINNWGFNMVMDAYVKSTRDAKYVEELYHTMLDMAEEFPGTAPDKVTYTCLMKAWIQEGKPGFYERVEELLTRMQRSPQKSSKPDQVTFGVVLDGLVQSGGRGAGNRASAIFRRMLDQGVEPNRVIFNSLISIRGKEGGLEGAEELLREMDLKPIGHQCRPSTVTFNSIIAAWARSERSDECFDAAMRLLEELVRRFNDGEHLCNPQEMTLTAVLSALANSSKTNKAERVKMLLEMFEQQFRVAPNRIIFSSVIYVCSTESGDEISRQDALALAVSTFQKIRHKLVGTDNAAAIHGALLDACYKLPSSEKDKERVMTEAFANICEDGHMHPSVLYIFRRAFPDSPLLEGIGNDTSMPSTWTRNVL